MSYAGTDYVLAAGFTPDGRRVVTAGDDEAARVWSAETGEMLELLEGTEQVLMARAFTASGTRPITATWEETARIWSPDNNKATAVLEGLDRTPTATAFSPDGSRLVVGFADGTASIWSSQTGEELAALEGHEGEINALAFSPDGRRIVSASDDETARIWSVDTGATLAVLRGHDDSVNAASFSPDGSQVVTGSDDETARIWSAETEEELAVLSGHDGYVTAAVFSPDGQSVATASEDQTARLWSVAVRGPGIVFDAASQRRQFRGAPARPEHDFAQLSPAGDRVVTVDVRELDPAVIDLWSATSGEHIATLLQRERAVGAYFGPDGEYVAVIGDRYFISTIAFDASFISNRRFIMGGQIWSAETGELLGTVPAFGTGDLTPTGDYLLMYGNAEPATLWPVSRQALLTAAEALLPIKFDEQARTRLIAGR